jgi:hypothetical protein
MRSQPRVSGPFHLLNVALRALFAGALGASAAGCVADNEAIVFVAPSIEEPSVDVAAGALGTTLTGSFRLRLRLGPRASGPSQVAVQKFEIANADQSMSIVPTLEAKADADFPVTVNIDSEKNVLFTIDLGGSVLPAMTAEQLCGAGGLTLAGTITDSLQDGATPVASSVFTPSGCSN